jgi:N,N-dimethylformamidase
VKSITQSFPFQAGTSRQWGMPALFIVVLLSLFFHLPFAVAAERVDEPERTLIGYSSELSVRPGDSIDFMVNAINGGSYKADLVRVINGESQSVYGDQFKLENTPSALDGTYKGTRQELNLGSYVHVQDTAAIDQLQSFTVSGWIYPVFDPTTFVPPDLENPDPFHPPSLTMAPKILNDPQTIVSRFDATTQTGWALRLNPKMQLEFAVGNGAGDLKVVTISETVQKWGWSYVAASFDAQTGTLSVHLQEKPYAPGDQLTARTLMAKAAVTNIPQAGSLRIAAVRNGPGAARATYEKPGHNFNGRIQDIRISNQALNVEDISAMAASVVPENLKASLVADFDLSKEISSTKIIDVSSSGMSGVVVNLPNRAVRGRFWAGETINWTERPDLYDAITFYADDIYDAQWSSDFSFTIPDNMKSGVYCARLTQGDFVEYITFFVAAPKGKPSARLAFWVSDYNYLAYVGISLGVTAKKNYPSHNWNEPDLDFLRANPEYAVGGMYDTHVDGRNFAYGTRLRPDVGMKPGALTYNFTEDTHVTAFLEHFGHDYDVITDELVDEEGLELLKQYDVIISSTHPEYVTVRMLNDIGTFTADGGRFMYIGGNGYFWSVGQHNELPGVMESRNFFDIPDRYLSNGQRGGLIIETGLHTGPVFGVECSAMIFNGSSAYRRLSDAENPRAAWIFAGTTEGEVFGNYGIDRVHGAAAGFEIDKFNPGNGVPRHALNLATSEPLKEKIEEVKMATAPISIHYTPASPAEHGQADLVFFETANGGAMFSTGSITWMSSTPEKKYNNDVAKITNNVLKRFLDPKPFVDIDHDQVKDVTRIPPNPEYEHMDQQ